MGGDSAQNQTPSILNMAWKLQADFLKSCLPLVPPSELMTRALKSRSSVTNYQAQKVRVKAVVDSKRMAMAMALILKPNVCASIVNELGGAEGCASDGDLVRRHAGRYH